MKSTKRLLVLLSVMLMLVLCVTALTACNEPDPTPDCTHEWVKGNFTVKPICGEVAEGKQQYTCSLCGETKEETVTNNATECAWETHEVTLEPTCTEEGTRTYTCTNCGNTKDVSIASLGGHKLDIYNANVDYEANKRQIPCLRCDHTVEKEAYVKYSDYGAVGDGVADDVAAIRDTHAYANEWGIDVWADEGATYYIGSMASSAIIQTNVDWKDATFYIDDTVIPWNSAARSVNIFKVTSKMSSKTISVPAGMTLTAGQENIGLTFDEPCMLYIQNDNERIFIRKSSTNNDSGDPRNEIILVDANGNVDPSTPIQYDYAAITSIKAYPITDAPITIKGGHIKTVTCDPSINDPEYVNNYCYFSRGISIERSNTTITDTKYTKEGEHTASINYNSKGVPYAGTFTIKFAYNVTLSNSDIQGHKAYSFFEKNGARNEMGSYTINANNCIGLKLIGLTQIVASGEKANITDRTLYHGLMGSNYCRNTLMEDCYVDRFDSHKGMHNATIKDSTLGFGILVIGGGDLVIENVTRLSGNEFITLRYDYNSVFNGDVYITNCTAESSIVYLIGGNWLEHYNGLPNYVVRNVYIDGLTLKSGANVVVYNILGVLPGANTNAVNPLYLPETIVVKGVTGKLLASNQTLISENVTVTRKR